MNSSCIELTGKHNTCKVFTENTDDECIRQLIGILNLPSLKDSKIRIMPDCHAGKGCVIGTTMTITDSVIPSLVGVDVGCGMLTIKLKEQEIDFEKLDQVIRSGIPFGYEIHNKIIHPLKNTRIEDLRCPDIAENYILRSAGTLGGGNHFIEIDKDEEENLYLVIHSGSRYLGKQIAEYYQKQAVKQHKDSSIQAVIEELKKQNRHKEIEQTILKLKKERPSIPDELQACEGKLMEDYLHDMKIAQSFASENRFFMADAILKGMNLHPEEIFETVHNYIDLDQRILRKGSVSAKKDEKLLIPINMRDGSLICTGKGNEDWNCSAPHGAGRIMSRRQAKDSISLEDYKKTMNEAGIFSTCINENTIDESPFAYKSIEEIAVNIEPTADIVNVIKPVYNFKAN